MTGNEIPLTEGETWTVEQAGQAMLKLAVDGASGWAEQAFLLIDEAKAAAVLPEQADEVNQFAATVVSQFARDLTGVGDRIADRMNATAAQRNELNRRRMALYEHRMAELVATAAPRGCA